MKPKFLISEIEQDFVALQDSFLSDMGGDSGPLIVMGKRQGSDDTNGAEDGYHKKVGGEEDSAQGPLVADV